MKQTLLFSLALALFLSSCDKDTDSPNTPTDETYKANGVIIFHEGTSQVPASLSFLNTETNTLTNDVYQLVNNKPLGLYIQDVMTDNSYIYVASQGTDAVKLLYKNSFKEAKVNTSIPKPFGFYKIDDTKVYVSYWGTTGSNGGVANYNPINNTATLIPTGHSGPSQILKADNFIYVLNNGGYTLDSTITVIKESTNEIITHLNVGYNPTSMGIDKEGYLWVLCAGKFGYIPGETPTPGRLVKINLSNQSIVQTLTFPTNNDHPSKLIFNASKDKIYYLDNGYGGALYELDITATTLPTAPALSGSFYSVNLIDNLIYTTDANGFTANGFLKTYSPSNYTLQNSYTVGIAPSGIRKK